MIKNKRNVVLLIKQCTEAAMTIGSNDCTDFSGFGFAACFDSFNILHVKVTLIHFTSNNNESHRSVTVQLNNLTKNAVNDNFQTVN